MPALISFTEPLNCEFRKSSGGLKVTFEAARDYMVSGTQLDRLTADPNVKNRVFRLSRLDNRIPNFTAKLNQPAAGQRESVLVYNGSGGYGDQILTWPFARILASTYDVHVLADPGNNVCWWNMPFVKSVQTIPIQWNLVKMYDHYALFENVINMDEHPDQEHPLDVMLRKVGLNPDMIDPKHKKVTPLFTINEMQAAAQWLQKGKIGIYQLTSTNKVRSFPAPDSAFHLARLAEAFPEVFWLAIYDEFVPPEFPTLATEQVEKLGLKNVQVVKHANMRDLWAVTRLASVVVGPDSMMVHLAGSLGRPCVGLWGPMNPMNRVRYYTDHKAIWHRQNCPNAPCYSYGSSFPRHCPPRPGERTVCECLGGISSEEIVDTVREALAEPAEE